LFADAVTREKRGTCCARAKEPKASRDAEMVDFMIAV
jgi:hypothetical protein